MFTLAIYALGKAGRTPPTLEVIVRSDAGLHDQAFNVPSFMRSIVEPTLQGFRSLLLTIEAQPNTQFISGQGHSEGFSGASMGEFLAQTYNLTHLRLNFKSSTSPFYPFLAWLAEPVPSATDNSNDPEDTGRADMLTPPPVALPHLQRLELGMLVAHPDDVLSVVEKFAPTLKEITFWKVILEDKTRPDAKGCNYWSGLLSAMAKLPKLHLGSFQVGLVEQRPQNTMYKYVWFKTENLSKSPDGTEDEEEEQKEEEDAFVSGGIHDANWPETIGYEKEVKLQGIDTMSMLASLARKVKVQWKGKHHPDGYDSSDEDMSDYENDEDEEMEEV
jgi:hypothetical protein